MGLRLVVSAVRQRRLYSIRGTGLATAAIICPSPYWDEAAVVNLLLEMIARSYRFKSYYPHILETLTLLFPDDVSSVTHDELLDA